MNTAPSGSSVLAVRAGGMFCGIPLAHVEEVMRPLPVNPLAAPVRGVAGIAVVRGRATPVVDLAVLLGGADEKEGRARFVTVRTGQRPAVLRVDSVVSLRDMNAERFEELPPLWRGERSPAVAAVGVLDRELFLVLDSLKLLPEALATSGETEAVP